jgi:hypothetical protein
VKDRGATRRIRDLAERQHGVVARWQLDSIEIGATLVQGRLEAGILVPLSKGSMPWPIVRLAWMAAG